MRFDSNHAWKAATAAVAGNRDMLLAITGVFILLPAFAIMVFVPEPTIPAKATPDDLLSAYSAYFTQAWPWMVGMTILHLIGTLAMIALITDARRPTVGEAIRIGLRTTLPAGAAMLILFLILSFVAGLPLNLAALSGSAAMTTVGLAAGLGILLYGIARSLPVLPVVVAERLNNPFAVLRRAFALSRGNGGRLLAFYALIFLVFVLIRQLFLAGLTILLDLIIGGEGAALVIALAASSIDAAMSVYLAAVLAAIHRQLAEPAPV
ncbi:MAG: hypothetical protein RLZZ427_410 [Pseudomonadota bacterium]|jgi:hypothetical protein